MARGWRTQVSRKHALLRKKIGGRIKSGVNIRAVLVLHKTASCVSPGVSRQANYSGLPAAVQLSSACLSVQTSSRHAFIDVRLLNRPVASLASDKRMWSWILGFIEWRHAVIKWIDVPQFQVNVIIATLKPKVCYRRLWKSYMPACFPPLVLSFCCRLDNHDMALDWPLSWWMMNFRIMSQRAFPCTHILALSRECWPSLWLSTICQNVSARCLDGTSLTGPDYPPGFICSSLLLFDILLFQAFQDLWQWSIGPPSNHIHDASTVWCCHKRWSCWRSYIVLLGDHEVSHMLDEFQGKFGYVMNLSSRYDQDISQWLTFQRMFHNNPSVRLSTNLISYIG